VNAFLKILRDVIADAPFGGSQRALAQHAGCDQALLSRVLSGEREPTPEFVGRLCATLPSRTAAALLKTYLDSIVESIAATKRKAGTTGAWKPLLSHLKIHIECEPRRKSA